MLVTGAYGAGSVMLRVEKKGDPYAVSELFKNPDFGAHTQPPVLHDGHFYSHYTINERSDGLVAMGMDGRITWNNFRGGGRIVRIGEAPRRINVDLVESTAAPGGVGDPGVPPVAPAIANAVFALTRKRIRELPLSKSIPV